MASKLICELLRNWCNYIGSSLIFAIISIMFLWCIQKIGWKEIVIGTWSKLRTDKHWIYRFLFLMYSYFILDRTLLSRHFAWTNGMKNVLTGGWGFYMIDTGEFTFEAIENFLFFVPLMIFYFASYEADIRFRKCIKKSFLSGFSLSLFIEMNQLFFKVGEFQVADLVYNTAGAILGGCIFKVLFTLYRK